MLVPAWGYVDQPLFTPLIVHGVSQVVDTVWAIRLPGTLFVAASVVVVGLFAREFGGDRAPVVVVPSNYGQAGAVDRFAPDLPVVGGQNALWDQT